MIIAGELTRVAVIGGLLSLLGTTITAGGLWLSTVRTRVQETNRNVAKADKQAEGWETLFTQLRMEADYYKRAAEEARQALRVEQDEHVETRALLLDARLALRGEAD